jgi:hypothetical protein
MEPRRIYLGHHVYGSAAIVFGVVTFVWRDFNDWQQIRALGNISHREILIYFAAAVELFGGIAIQWRPTRRIGAATLGAIYFLFALLWVPFIFANPPTYGPWGSIFEQCSLVSGALLTYVLAGQNEPGHSELGRIGKALFSVCVISFTIVQIVYLSGTASLVPKWIPPGQMFWAIITTIAFAFAAIALLSGRSALLASRLLTLMVVGFGLLIWLPAVVSDPHKLFNWAANAQNLAIAGASWIVTEYLARDRDVRSISSCATRSS